MKEIKIKVQIQRILQIYLKKMIFFRKSFLEEEKILYYTQQENDAFFEEQHQIPSEMEVEHKTSNNADIHYVFYNNTTNIFTFDDRKEIIRLNLKEIGYGAFLVI